MKILRSFSIIAGLVLVGNLLGYVRDLALASNFGASTTTDAYFAAFFLPNTLSFILLSNSIALVFLPIFIEYLHKDKDEAWRIASTVFNFSFLLLIAVVLITSLTVHYWIPVLFSGFDETTTQLAIDLALILLPMLLFLGLSALLTAILNSFEHFTVPALAPAVANVFVIIVILSSSNLGGIRAVALGVTISTMLQFLIQIPILFKFGVQYHFVLDLRHRAFRQIFRLAVPLITYLMIAYATLAVERNLASALPEGSISAVNYAFRLFSIPIAFFASSLGTVIYPRLSSEFAKQDIHSFSNKMLRAMGATTMFLLPLSFWVIINSRSIVNLLFGYGRFSENDVHLTAIILSGYAIGMMANGVTRILQRSFYAMQNTMAPFLARGISFLFYVGLAIFLTRRLGVAGLGIARGILFIFILVISLWLLNRRSEITFNLGAVFSIVGRYFLASLCAAIVWLGLAWVGDNLSLVSGRFIELMFLIFTGVAGAITFGIVAYLLKSEEIRYIKNQWLYFRGIF